MKKKLWYLAVVLYPKHRHTGVFSGVCPIASWAETGGRGIYPGNPSPTSIRNHTRFSEKNPVKLRRCLKYHTHQKRDMIYLNTHWQLGLGSAAVRDSCYCCRTTP